MSCQYVADLVISEAAYSFGQTPANIFFRSWMNSKTMNLDLLLTVGHMWKILVCLLGFRFGFVNALMSSESSI